MKYFDMHCDTLYELSQKGGSLRTNEQLHISLNRTARFTHYAQFFAMFCGLTPPEDDADADQRLTALLAVAEREITENEDLVLLCRSAAELDRSVREKKSAVFLSIEGAELLPTPEAVQRAYEAGVRLITLTWNHRSVYGCPAKVDMQGGLTDAGRELVRQCNALGIIVDASHLSERGFWEICEVSDEPFAASHSNARALCPHTRNLSDAQFSELVRRGGVAGLNLYPAFLREGEATIDDVLRHYAHFLSLGGEKTVCMGADWDGIEAMPNGMNDIMDMLSVDAALAEHGYDETQRNALFYDNLSDFVHRIL